VSFVSADALADRASALGVPDDVIGPVVEEYEDAQLQALKTGLLACAAIAAVALLWTKGLPKEVQTGTPAEAVPVA
jgi:hypothetical protein